MKSSTFFLGHGLHPLPDDLPPPRDKGASSRPRFTRFGDIHPLE